MSNILIMPIPGCVPEDTPPLSPGTARKISGMPIYTATGIKEYTILIMGMRWRACGDSTPTTPRHLLLRVGRDPSPTTWGRRH